MNLLALTISPSSSLLRIGALALALGASSIGCASEVDTTESTDDAYTSSNAVEIAKLKTQIKNISRANMTRTDNFSDVEDDLRPLIAKLVKLTKNPSRAQKLNLLEGNWHQLWSNLTNPIPGFLDSDLTEIYQVVSKDGYYYNYGGTKAFKILNTTAVLRGKYTIDRNDDFAIEFTRSGFLFKKLDENDDLLKWTREIESGDRNLYSTGSGKAPNGPVGITGKLTTIYVDKDLRIAGGEQTPFKVDGEVKVPGKTGLLFVLER